MQTRDSGKAIFHYLRNKKEVAENRTVKYATPMSRWSPLTEEKKDLLGKIKALINRSNESDTTKQAIWYHGRTTKGDTCDFGDTPHLHIYQTSEEWDKVTYKKIVSGNVEQYKILSRAGKVGNLEEQLQHLKNPNFFFMGTNSGRILDAWEETPEGEDGIYRAEFREIDTSETELNRTFGEQFGGKRQANLREREDKIKKTKRT